MQKTVFFILFALCQTLSLSLQAQILEYGDSSVTKGILKNASDIYEGIDSNSFILTENNIQRKILHGTSIQAGFRKGVLSKIIITGCTASGRIATEYYLKDKKLIFVYYSEEFFQETGNRITERKNFKNISSIEGRFYYINESPVYYKHEGLSQREAIYPAEIFIAEKNSVLRMIKQ